MQLIPEWELFKQSQRYTVNIRSKLFEETIGRIHIVENSIFREPFLRN